MGLGSGQQIETNLHNSGMGPYTNTPGNNIAGDIGIGQMTVMGLDDRYMMADSLGKEIGSVGTVG